MSGIIYFPQLGKPNPLEAKMEGPDVRDRINQKKSIFDCCVFGVFSILREHYKAPNTNDLPERKIEKICSLRKRELIDLKKSIPYMASEILDPAMTPILKSLTKEALNSPKMRLVDMLDISF